MTSTPIAIIGLSGRYPGGAASPALLWEVLRSGTDAVGEVPSGRWDDGYYHPDPDQPGRVYTRAGGFLDSIDTFDAEFFGMSPREARQVDPQHRLALELAWEVLEDAALVPKHLAGSRTGVFIGISNHDYADLVGTTSPDAYSNIGSALSISANRISYVFDLHGPSFAIDTACSSGLVSVHQACRSLIDGSSEMALAGAVNILSHARPWIGFAKASMLSPTGRCRSFDASGDGYVRAEGGGMVLLKPLEAAERDGDRIYGVILATGINSDGRTMGLAMPNVSAQEALLRQVYGECGVAPEDVFYVEAHGTGTAVGDPIECEALGRVLGAPRQDSSRLHIGSVKSNIGHLEPASGIAGLTKLLLALRNRELPANLHFNTPNPKIDFAAWNLNVVDRAIELPDRETPLVFGINSFGFGGTNAHAVLREYRPLPAAAKVFVAAAHPAGKLLLLSAQSEGALNDMAHNYAAWLREQKVADWADICATAALCRAQHGHRLALAATSPEEAAAKLDSFRAGDPTTALATGRAGAEPGRIAFVYSGNGPQWWAMGRELLDASEVFRAEMAAVDELFFARAGWSVIAELRRPEAESRMALTEVAQPTLFALQLGLTAMLRDAGIMPAAVFGHSVGEVAAAFASGALSREQATDVIFHRSTMQARTAGHGKMAALGIGPDEARAAIDEFDGRLELAAVNGPRAVTVAGDSDALAILRDRLTEAGKFARTLPLNYAFHSRAMDPIREELLQRLDGLAPINAAVPFVSTVEGHSLDGASLGAAYWWRNIRAQVRFSDAVAHVARDLGITNFVEIGPHPVLRDYVLQTTKACDVAAAALQTLRRPTAERPEPESAAMWQTICACYAHGAGHPEVLFERPARPASLPAYPWQRVRHWRGAVPLPDAPSPTQREHPLLGWRPRGTEGVWQNTIDTTQLPYLADHMVQGAVLFPAAGYIELGLAAARLLRGDGPMALENLDIMRPLTLAARPIPALQCSVDIADGTWEVQSRPEMHAETWTTHLRGRLTRAECAAPRTADLQAMRAALPDYVDGAEHYADARSRGLAYGPAFQGVRAIWMSPPVAPHIAGEALPRTALADIALPALDAAALAGYRAHPALLDCCLQVLITLLGRTEKRRCAFIPVQVERVRSFAPLPAELVCRLTVTRESERSGSAEIEVFDTAGAPLLTMSGARFKKVDFRAGAGVLLTEGWRLDPSGTAWSTEPVALPAPQRIAASLAGDLPALAEAHGRTEYHSDVGPRLDALIGAYAVHALHDLAGGDSTFMLPQLQRRSRIDASQAALLRRLVEMTVEDGWLVRAGGALVWTADRALPDAARLWRELLLDHPAYGAELVLAARHGEQLVPRLRGELPAPDGFDSVTEQLCETAPFRALATSAVAATLRALVAEWPAGRPIRVLELGGASGGLTAALLPMLPASRTEYVFSDASEAALDRASLRFSGFHCLRTAPFDVTADPAAQGLPLGAFDVILAGEALHAAQDPAAALHHACTMLAPGGWLIRIERGGSRLEDLLFTSDSPALHLVGHGASADEALRAAGFVDFGRITEPACAGRQPEQAITITQRPDGVLSKAVQIPAEPTRRWLLLTGQADWAFAKAVAVSLHDREIGRAHV